MDEEEQRRMDEKVEAWFSWVEGKMSSLFKDAPDTSLKPAKPRFLSMNKRIIIFMMVLMMVAFFAILPQTGPDDLVFNLCFSAIITIFMTLIASLCLWMVSLILRQPKPHELLKKVLDDAGGGGGAPSPTKKPDADGN